MQAVTYSSLAVEVVLKMLEPNAPVMEGDYARAMSHRAENSKQDGWTPLLRSWSGSDKVLAKRDIIEKLVEQDDTGRYKFVPLRAFDRLRNDAVIVSCSLSWVPPTPSEAEPLPPPHLNLHIRMCTCVHLSLIHI